MPASPGAIPVAAERDYEAIAVGETAELPVVVTAEMVAQFAALSGDFNPLHMDAQYAQASPLGSRVVHGMLVAAFISQLIGMRLPGRRALIHSIQLEFVAPVRIGDRLLLQGRVTEKHDAFRCLSIALRVRRHDTMLVVRGSAQVGMLPDDGERNG